MDNNKAGIKGNNTNKVILGLFLIIFFVLVFLLNRLYPIHSDDWMYSFIFNENPPQRIGNVLDIIVSQYNHYLYWGGRNIVHFIDQLLLLLNPLLREILNSVAYTAFAFIIYRIANKGKETNPYLFLLVNLLVWLLTPVFPQTVIWITGSSNYLWGTLIILVFLSYYYSFYVNEKSKDSVLKNILFLFGGIIAGWTNENSVIALISILFILFLYCKVRKIKIPKWTIYGFIGVCIGCAVMLLAPGNFIRSKDTHAAFNLIDKPFLEVLRYKARNIYWIYKYVNSIGILILIYICLNFVFFCQNKDNRNYTAWFGSLLFFTAAHISALAMIASPIFPLRAAFCLSSFMIVSICIIYANVNMSNLAMKIINILILTALTVIFAFTYSERYQILVSLADRYEKRELYIEEQKEIGNKDIVLEEPPIILPAEFDFEDISNDPDSWRNGICADYYKLNSIKRINP
ncbi:hypothetical protein G7050_03845 [Dysgonomonas sp. HDW5A]|uniref:DUF3329 domain-containing protein n=1 Tax=Dysgonomonas sp. HDW5A TaxID=2714926 RepID=UPI00140D085B|nr:DUF6056 family protein [Dysgonomonas sp. HDW5A]QIK59019.1 hypothetical protein G7050_03845 [Dysgonomonas sp. HDW5A]